MPFTLSHAAAVLPALRRTGTARGPLVASALVAGSFAPDMTYYADSLIPGAMAFGEVTHAPLGVLTVDVLVTVALVGGWLLVREALVALLPQGWRSPVLTFVSGRLWRPRTTRELLVLTAWFVVSAVLGAATHVVWDAFTHPGRWGTRLVPGLDQVVGGLPVYTFVQYGTSALAAVALGWFGWSALRGQGGGAHDGGASEAAAAATVPVLAVRWRLLLTTPVLLCVVAGAVHRMVRVRDVQGATGHWLGYLPTVLFGGGAGLVLGLVLYGVAVRLVHRRTLRAGVARGAAGQVPSPVSRSAASAVPPSAPSSGVPTAAGAVESGAE
ncbi:DUF4184 family protein [Streptomyces sp. NEAU-Y11]|uniref:DUF4184 family protein n=1 Tax=Streptomyces cucumeris TaxID=2962890 RepID=UPI0020C8AD08|nr:DUF4184 family protein [Streptomyces sp. NEAU-Y11]MCP9210515.1 DUF4184 family protein [Streptomyces sp. NEAU-Y11]